MAKYLVDVSVFQQPKEGNFYCGDSYFYAEMENGFICALADGLGSGEFANESSQIVIDIIKDNKNISIEKLVEKANERLLGKRGVVLGILKIEYDHKTYSFSSIGNVGIIRATKEGKTRSIPNAGFLAGYKRPFKVIKGKLESAMNFIMFSDGVKDKELAKMCMKNSDVHEITKSYVYVSEEEKKDDTTLIAIRYTEQP
ncbi:indirect negative regulator of sigma-B activity [Oceanobacillus halophilus]|uniref:Indirect negative regulator of sigma-B activity n=1 Tax=Oceanobacillus halophilus TaxID=930130 RepID=A0A495A081_9BACI|nr:indirect negative regulator of sigma-B activity [Oceanobacillus halophilus]RKQ30943.1 indirect negative regulator of sigma-B activity [Oceanobacillus halophilus]